MKKSIILHTMCWCHQYNNLTKRSCQNFWHFCMGEFLPVISIFVKNNYNHIYLFNDHRTFNTIFDKFYKNLENENLTIEFINNKDHLNNINEKHIKHWDWDWNEEDKKDCLIAINWLKIQTLKYFNAIENKNDQEVLIQLRKNNAEINNYYKTMNIKWCKYYGFRKRGYKDMEILIEYVKKYNFKGNLCYSDGEHIYKQIYPYIGKNKLILTHGAGMFFILFMQENSKIIEIIPQVKVDEYNGAAQGIKRICKFKKSGLKRIIKRTMTSVKNISVDEFSFDNNFDYNFIYNDSHIKLGPIIEFNL